jgi:hypothetical protein
MNLLSMYLLQTWPQAQPRLTCDCLLPATQEAGRLKKFREVREHALWGYTEGNRI